MGVPSSLTFNTGDSSNSFTVVAVDDEVEDNGEMVELGFRDLPAGFVPGSPPTAPNHADERRQYTERGAAPG